MALSVQTGQVMLLLGRALQYSVSIWGHVQYFGLAGAGSR